MAQSAALPVRSTAAIAGLALFLHPRVQWKREIDSKVTLPNGKPLPVVLLANKCDLPDTAVQRDMLNAFCKEHGFIGWFETSAKTNHNIEESVRGLVASILSHPGECALTCLRTPW